MSYTSIEYDQSKYIRCSRCGVLKKRVYNPRVTDKQVEAILTLREHTGFGYMKIARYLKLNIQTVQRVVRNHERANK